MIYRCGLKVLDDDDFVVATLTSEAAFVDMSKIYHASVDEDGEWDVAQAVLEGLIEDPLLAKSHASFFPVTRAAVQEVADMLRTARIEDARSRNNDRM